MIGAEGDLDAIDEELGSTWAGANGDGAVEAAVPVDDSFGGDTFNGICDRLWGFCDGICDAGGNL